MTRRILVLQAHPDPAGGHLGHALAEAYASAATAAGHAVEQLSLAQLALPPLQSEADFLHGTPPPAVAAAQAAMQRAEHWAIFFPLWLGAAPALLKSFLEQTCRPGFAFGADAKGFPPKLLKGRSARLVVTMGMPALLYRLWYGAHGIRALEQGVLGFIGIAPIRRTLIGGAGGLDAQPWLSRLSALGRDAA